MKIGVDLFVNLKEGSISKYYTTNEVLGQGAFGKVWKVTHKTTGKVLYLTFRVNPCNEVVKKISVDQGRRIKIVL
jgi:hypothetical protein